MPHKHKRDKSTNASYYDLPPTALARPLPVLQTSSTATKTTSQKPRRKAKKRLEDDTPRAFTRLLNYTLKGRKPPSGLDDDSRPPSKKRKRNTDTSNSRPLIPNRAASTSHIVLDTPKILPSESLSAFRARVDAALPVIGLVRSQRGGGLEGEGGRQTKMERKMQRMQQEWRETDRRRKERAEEEEADMKENGDDEIGVGVGVGMNRASDKIKTKGKKKKKSKGDKNEPAQSDFDDDDDDPWAVVARKRAAEQAKNQASTSGARGLVGLHDVVLAPPKLSSVPRVKIRGGVGGVGSEPGHGVQPTAIGLKRQAELGDARRSVIEGYRQMMRERRGEANGDGGGGDGSNQ